MDLGTKDGSVEFYKREFGKKAEDGLRVETVEESSYRISTPL